MGGPHNPPASSLPQTLDLKYSWDDGTIGMMFQFLSGAHAHVRKDYYIIIPIIPNTN
jgi:hypothetical protein